MSVKNDVLKILGENTGKYISGEEIALSLGVSRNAVWKAVKALKNDSCDISSVTNRGYFLNSSADLLNAECIRDFLPENYKGINIYYYKSIGSTNDEAKRLVSGNEKNVFLVVADEQTAGRGRSGHTFYSPAKTGLYMTLVIHPELKLSQAANATTAAACAVVKAVQTLTHKRPLIKWVNDVFLDGKKICGILTEAVSDFESGTVQSLIVGIGVNISTSDFPEELRNTASSLNDESLTRNILAAEILKNFLSYSENLGTNGHIKFYKENSFVLGKEITYFENNIEKTAVATDIDNNGGLVVKDSNGENHTLQSGEISIKIKK